MNHPQNKEQIKLRERKA